MDGKMHDGIKPGGGRPVLIYPDCRPSTSIDLLRTTCKLHLRTVLHTCDLHTCLQSRTACQSRKQFLLPLILPVKRGDLDILYSRRRLCL